MNLEGKRDCSSAYVKDEDCVLLREVELIRERGIRWFHTLLHAKSPKLDPNTAKSLDQWPENMLVGVQPTMQELAGAIHSLANGKAFGPDGVSVELFKITLNDDPALHPRLLGIVVRTWTESEVPQQWKYAINMVLQGGLAGSAHRQDTAAEDHRSPPHRVPRARGDSTGGTEEFPTKPFHHRYEVCDSSATGVVALRCMYVLSIIPKRTSSLTEPSSGQYSPVLTCHRI